MRHDTLTLKSQEALAEAQRIAGEENQQELSPGHLLLAMLAQADGVTPPLLAQAGVQPGAVEQELRRSIEKTPRVHGAMAAPPSPGRELRFVLEEASREAAALQDDYVSVEHLLLALTANGAGETA